MAILATITIYCLCCLGLSACAMGTVTPEAVRAGDETATPSRGTGTAPAPATAPPLAIGTTIAGVDVGALSDEAAAARLQEHLAPVMLPLELHVGAASTVIRPIEFGLYVPMADMLAEARAQQAQGRPGRVPLRVRFSEPVLRVELDAFAEQTATPPELRMITGTDRISRSFAYVPGQRIDVDEAIKLITDRLQSPLASRRITLERHVTSATPPPRPSFAVLRAHVEALAAEWEGVVGFYLHDLTTGETLTLNEQTVFSGASVVKVAILLRAYIVHPAFDADLQEAIDAMIIESDNMRANDVLAATAGGPGTDNAYIGVLEMTEMLRDLGFEHTYMNMPYEGFDYLVGLRGLTIKRGPPIEGPPPHTDPDPILRTTPAEMSRLFLLIDECRRGRGLLIERYPKSLTPARCQEMLDLLAANNDTSRMVSGMPPGTRIEHKSGWVQDMHADVGIVRSEGGDFLLAVYLWRGVEEVPDFWASPFIIRFARLVYSAYNPVALTSD